MTTTDRSSIPAVDEHRRAFLEDELKHLRSEDQLLRREAWRVEAYSVGASATVVSWLATHSVTMRLAWCIPLIIILVAGARFGSMMRHLEYRVRDYVASEERRILGPSGGWQSFSKGQSSNQALANWIIWSVLLLSALSVAVFGGIVLPSCKTDRSAPAAYQASPTIGHLEAQLLMARG